jgi:hypothetical protein
MTVMLVLLKDVDHLKKAQRFQRGLLAGDSGWFRYLASPGLEDGFIPRYKLIRHRGANL